MSPRKQLLLSILVLFCIALTIRVVYLNQLKASPLFIPSEATIDEYLYHSWAQEIAFRDPIGTEAFWGLPLYPYFLGFLYFVFGPAIYLIKFIQCVMGGITCILIYVIGRKVFDQTVGVIAGLLYALYNAAIFYEGFLISAALAAVLNCYLLLLVLSFQEKPTYKRSVAVGVLVGIASLATPSILLFAVLLAVWLRRSVKYLAIALVCCIAVIGIVTFRNYVVAKDFIPITAHNGITFYGGNNPGANGSFNLPLILGTDAMTIKTNAKAIAQKLARRPLKPSEVSAFWFAEGVKFIGRRPGAYLQLLFKKFLLFFNHREISDVSDMDFFKRFAGVLKLPLVNFGLLCAWGILGLLYSLRHISKKSIVLYLFLGSVVVSLMIYFVNTRYRLPAVPILAILAAYGLRTCYAFIRQRNIRQVALCVAGIGLFYGIGSVQLVRPSLEVFYANLGAYYTNNKRYPEAMEEFAQGLKLNPDYVPLHVNLGLLYLNREMYGEAIGEYKKAIALNADYPVARNNLAIAYKRMGLIDEATKEYQAAIALNPGYASPYYNLGILYAEIGKTPEAIEEFKKVLELTPQEYRAHNKLAELYSSLGQQGLAADHLKQSLSINPDQPEIRQPPAR